MLWVPWILSGASLLLALLTLVRTFVVAGQSQSEKTHDDISHIQARLDLIEMKLGVFWKLVEENLSTMLKKPTHNEMDHLLDKLEQHTLTLDEAYRLRGWIRQVYLDTDTATAQERMIATLVLGAVNSLIQEYERAPTRADEAHRRPAALRHHSWFHALRDWWRHAR